jgi:TolB-like protein
MSLLSELRRRNVHRMAALYAAAAWLVMQVVDVVEGKLPLPDWMGSAVIAALAVGFPIALVISWFYEITPEGISPEHETVSDAAVKHVAGRRTDVIVISLLVAAVLMFAVDRWRISRQVVLDESIAVLAFENLSPDPDNAFFAEGISEEILNVLAGIDGLTVISRTSAFLFRGSNTPIPEIGRALGVAHVLEGSVRRAGNEVRVTAQLIDARNDKHLWSASYEREMSDIFAIQEEIARSVAASISSVIDVKTVENEMPSVDLVAYELYLRSLADADNRPSEIRRGIALLREAVDRDPSFAEAWARLANYLAAAPGWGIDSDDIDEVALAEEAARNALELDPGLGGAITVQAVLADGRKNFIEAEFLHRHAVNVSPNNVSTHTWFGIFCLNNGYFSQAIQQFERALELDPLSGNINKLLGSAYLAAGQAKLAEPRFAMATEYNGGFGHVYFNRLVLAGEIDSAIAYAAGAMGNHPHVLRLLDLMSQALHERSDEAVAALIAEEDTLHGAGAWYNQTILFALDLRDELFEHIAAEMQKDPSQFTMYDLWPVWLPGNRSYAEDPHFFKIMGELGSAELWNKVGYPEGCRKVSDASGDHLNCEGRYR